MCIFKLFFKIFLIIFTLFYFTFHFAEARIVIDERLGVAHVAGQYPLKYEDFLRYGAEQAFKLGFQSIELYLSPEICARDEIHHPYGYYQTLDWCGPNKNAGLSADYKSITDLAKHPRYQQVFALPYKTFLLTTETVTSAHAWGIAGYNRRFYPSELEALYNDFKQLALYFLDTYKNSNKTFIIQTPNELDWHLISNKGTAPSNRDAEPDDFAIENAKDYLNTIQRAIDDAKKQIPPQGMKLYHSCEINMILKAMSGKKSATNSVVPFTNCDLYGYSSYETALLETTNNFLDALNYLKNKAPDSPDFGANNVFISEIGSAENLNGTQWSVDKMKLRYQQALDFNVPYIFFWQLYDNECQVFNPTNNQCVGYWIFKPDNTLSSFYTQIFSKPPYATEVINNAQFVSQSVPIEMIVNQSYNISITMKNTGNRNWTKNDLYRLGSQNPQDNLIWKIGRVPLSDGESITPGTTKTFTFSVTAPSTPGTYNFQWRMLQEMVQWFGDFTPNILISVKPANTSDTTPPSVPTGLKVW